MKALLKYGGLTFSATLTLSLFTRLFGFGAYGLAMALAALALFEIGAAGWSHLLKTARDGQRQIARVCLSITVALSLMSSIAEIVMATKLGAESLALIDLPFVTLMMIGLALSSNVIGAITYEYATPEVMGKMRELERQAKARRAAEDLEDKVTDLAITRAEAEVQGVSAEVAGRLAIGLRDNVVSRLLAAETRPALSAAPTAHRLTSAGLARPVTVDDPAPLPVSDVVDDYPTGRAPVNRPSKPSKNGNGHSGDVGPKA